MLTTFSVADLESLSHAMRDMRSDHGSMAEAAAEITGLLYREFQEPSGGPACINVRIQVSQILAALPPMFARAALEVDPAATAETPCLVGLSSNGHVDIPEGGLPEEWALPITARVFAELPMMPRLLEQIGMELDAVTDPGRAVAIRLQHRSFNVYLATDLAEDEVLLPNPVHRALVRDRGIKSFVAAAGVLPTGGLLLISFQTSVVVTPEIAEMLRPLATSVKATLIPYSRSIFPPAPWGA